MPWRGFHSESGYGVLACSSSRKRDAHGLRGSEQQTQPPGLMWPDSDISDTLTSLRLTRPASESNRVGPEVRPT